MKKYQLMVGKWSYQMEAKWNALSDDVKQTVQMTAAAVVIVIGAIWIW